MNLLYLVVAMAIVTYIPRMLPLVLLQNVSLPSFISRFMRFIPYAALGALVFPGALTSSGPGHMGAAAVGCLVAIGLAWFERNLIFVIAGGIAGVFMANVFL